MGVVRHRIDTSTPEEEFLFHRSERVVAVAALINSELTLRPFFSFLEDRELYWMIL